MVNDLEKYVERKKKAEKRIIIGAAIILIGALGLLIGQDYGFIILIIGVIVGGVFAGLGANDFQKLSKTFKVEVISGLMESLVDNGKYDPHFGLSQTQVYSSEFLKRADRYHSEDFLSGSMEDVNFVSSDVKLEERHVRHTKNGTETYYETYFLGRLFVFEFNKSFDGYLQVLEGARPTVNRKYKKVKLESVQFNKKFKTYSTSEHSAFYVLTPHFMEALLNFEKKNRGKIYFSFIDNMLYIGINNFIDTFELKMFRKLDNTVFAEFERDLLVIKDVIIELKLNNSIFQ
ncbi:hypothetical protein KQ51_01277 [Candidatus Izimaplasma bacterium HR1]|jgi:hypothetical protein|uniref:DUF3137 domain-containing protein n=1 Tax=Candidatus Izimoplasma sp. HR1 TaxID=1541959 RepID=UPI0004F8DF49|nr:hypothetical protein KQ51_01277 [Candidatus Izimaplasma bacterium HR1]